MYSRMFLVPPPKMMGYAKGPGFVMWNLDSGVQIGLNFPIHGLHHFDPKCRWYNLSVFWEVWCGFQKPHHSGKICKKNTSLPQGLQKKTRHIPWIWKQNRVIPPALENKTTSLPQDWKTKPRHSPSIWKQNHVTPPRLENKTTSLPRDANPSKHIHITPLLSSNILCWPPLFPNHKWQEAPISYITKIQPYIAKIQPSYHQLRALDGELRVQVWLAWGNSYF